MKLKDELPDDFAAEHAAACTIPRADPDHQISAERPLLGLDLHQAKR